jgi:peroxiredoxin
MTKQAFWVDTATLRKINERAMLLDPLLIGKKAPQLVLADSNRKYVPLYSVKAKYTVVFFWDPNCGHCQKETPKLNEVYKKYKNDGVEVYAVDIDRDRKKWVEFINKNQLHWINVYDPDYYVSFKQLYDIYSTPVMYVLNEKKEIMFKRIGVEQFDDIMADILKKPKEKKPQQK